MSLAVNDRLIRKVAAVWVSVWFHTENGLGSKSQPSDMLS